MAVFFVCYYPGMPFGNTLCHSMARRLVPYLPKGMARDLCHTMARELVPYLRTWIGWLVGWLPHENCPAHKSKPAVWHGYGTGMVRVRENHALCN